MAHPFILTGGILGACNFYTVSIKIFNSRFDYRVALIFGLIATTLGIFLVTLIPHPVAMVIICGFTIGTGSAILAIGAYGPVWKFFPNNGGFIAGMITASMNIGTSVLGWVFAILVNPEDKISADNG